MPETLGPYLRQEDPAIALWLDLVRIVYGDSPHQPHPGRLSAEARTLFEVGAFHSEMRNGGFHQYLSGLFGGRARETLAALRQIGADLCAGLLERALTIFPGGTAPQDGEERRALLCAFHERKPSFLQQLDQAFRRQAGSRGVVLEEDLDWLQLPPAEWPEPSAPEEDLEALQLEFIQANRAVRLRA